MKLTTFENRTKENSKRSNGYSYAKKLLITKAIKVLNILNPSPSLIIRL